MKKTITLFLLVLVSATVLYSQKEAYNWCFGYGCWVNFGANPPEAAGQTMMWAYEGCAAISDKSTGQLLFYTDGQEIWGVKDDGTHYAFDNISKKEKTSLNGHSSSTQVGVIIRKPGNDNLYYIFTTDAEGGPHGLQYSVVNTVPNSQGKFELAVEGSQLMKNVLINGSSTEKITAVNHRNGTDYWIIMHEWNNDSFCAYKLNSGGIDVTAPVVSQIGSVHDIVGTDSNQYHSHGYMKVSPDGTTIALAIFRTGKIEVFRFDNETGKVSPWFDDGTDFLVNDSKYLLAYGVEFSRDSRKLYVSCIDQDPSLIYQFNLSKIKSQADIEGNTKIIASTSEHSGLTLGAMQLAPDGKIYIAVRNSEHLGVINQPDKEGTGCGFVKDGLEVYGSPMLGMPSFIQSYFKPPADIKANLNPICEGDTLILSTDLVSDAIYTWTGPGNYKKSGRSLNWVAIPGITRLQAGQYTLEVNQLGIASYDTINIVVYIKPQVEIVYPKDTMFICEGKTGTITADADEYDKMVWSNADTGRTITVSTTGLYIVTATVKDYCFDKDSLYVVVVPNPDVTIAGETVINNGVPVVLTANSNTQGVTYQWNDGSGEKTLTVSNPGTYSVTVTNPNTGCTGTATVQVIDGTLFVPISGDTVMCGDQPVQMSLDRDYKSVIWSTGDTTKTITVSQPGTYTVDVSDGQGRKGSGSVNVHRVDMNLLFAGLQEVDFKRVYYGTSAPEFVYPLHNTTGYDLLIDSIRMKYNSDFTVNYPGAANYLLVNGGTLNLGLNFKPSGLGERMDEVTVWFREPFVCSYTAAIRGAGFANLVVSLPDYVRARVSTRNFDIPIKARLDVPDDLTYQCSFTDITVTYDAVAFYPNINAAETTKPITIDKVGDKLEVVMSPDKMYHFSKNPIEVANMRGQLGIVYDNSPVEFKGLPGLDSLCGRYLDVIVTGGVFDLYGICQAPLSKIFLTDAQAVSIKPNPANSEVKMKVFNTSGEHEISFYNTIGSRVHSVNVTKVSTEKSEEFNIDLSMLPAGVYRVVIRTSSGMITKPLVIVK